MESLRKLAQWEMIILVVSFGVVTLWKLFQSNSFSGLLQSKDKDASFSPGRAQMLAMTALAALQYLLATIQNPSHLPAVPSNLVTALGGSQLVYLGAKAWNVFGPNRR